MGRLVAVLLFALTVVPGGASPGRPSEYSEDELQAPSREDSARLRTKVDVIQQHATGPSTAPLTTRVTEEEVNAYLAFDAVPYLPAGLTEPRIVIAGEGRVSGTALLDLDALREQRKPRGRFDPVNLLSGRVAVSLAGRIDSADGQARFDLESARLGGVPIPKVIVAELVSFYSRTPENPAGLNLDDPFPLPARIRRIDVRRGEALIVQ